ncbi:hypothetical protein EHP00_924 [Ecytonucleospora hepatopenaei]|uniref:Uncharacterized protein n=1 Tax=Ecytonucleospora hepatopenaei TaxID=646526 RepID=A0A1W0E4S1_9MICR|nr:hypothetical protein EHP00_924 [Ecytonucleospora hepatopenaei]
MFLCFLLKCYTAISKDAIKSELESKRDELKNLEKKVPESFKEKMDSVLKLFYDKDSLTSEFGKIEERLSTKNDEIDALQIAIDDHKANLKMCKKSNYKTIKEYNELKNKIKELEKEESDLQKKENYINKYKNHLLNFENNEKIGAKQKENNQIKEDLTKQEKDLLAKKSILLKKQTKINNELIEMKKNLEKEEKELKNDFNRENECKKMMEKIEESIEKLDEESKSAERFDFLKTKVNYLASCFGKEPYDVKGYKIDHEGEQFTRNDLVKKKKECEVDLKRIQENIQIGRHNIGFLKKGLENIDMEKKKINEAYKQNQEKVDQIGYNIDKLTRENEDLAKRLVNNLPKELYDYEKLKQIREIIKQEESVKMQHKKVLEELTKLNGLKRNMEKSHNAEDCDKLENTLKQHLKTFEDKKKEAESLLKNLNILKKRINDKDEELNRLKTSGSSSRSSRISDEDFEQLKRIQGLRQDIRRLSKLLINTVATPLAVTYTWN